MAQEILLKKDPKKYVEQRNQTARRMFRGTTLINGCTLQYDTAFGINSNPISNQLQLVGQKYCVFMTGNIIVIRDLIDKSEKFISKEGRFSHVTALYSLYHEKQTDKAIAPLLIFLGQSSEGEDRNANIVIYRAYKEQMKVLNTNIKGTIKQISLNEEKQYLAVLMLSAQHTYISLWNYEKERFITNCLLKHNIEKISMHQTRPREILLIGRSYLRLWELHSQENVLKECQQQLVPLKTEKQNRFYDYSWLSGFRASVFLVLTSGNKVLVLVNNVLTNTLQLQEKNEMYSIAGTKKGFVVGGAAKSLSLYELDKNYNISNNVSLSSRGNQTVASTPSNEQKYVKIYVSSNDGLMTLTTTNQLGSHNFYIINSFRLDAEVSNIQSFFPAGFHNKKVNQLSVSITKQLLASCGEDFSVKVWNFFEHQGYEKKGVLSKTFKEQPLSVSLHPSGLFLAVGFSTGFKIFAIVNDSLVILKQAFISECKFIRYSHGGHFLLVNEKQHIFIYDSIYYETLHLFSLTSHVKQVAISHDDLYIVATCTSGYVFCFSLYESARSRQMHNKKGFQFKEATAFNCIGFDRFQSEKPADGSLFIGCSLDKYVRRFLNQMCIYKDNCKKLVAEFPVVDCHITSLCISRNLGVVFLGTNKGTVRICLWPLDQNCLEWELSGSTVKFKPPEFFELPAHNCSIATIVLSNDEQFLFSAAQDGTIMCLRIDQKWEDDIAGLRDKHSLIKAEDRRRIAQSANDLYLERIQKIEQKNEIIKKLKFQVVRSEQKLKLEKQKLDIMCKQKLDALQKQFNIAVETDKKIKQSYIQTSEKEYQELARRLEQERQKNEKQLKRVLENNEAKIAYEEQRNRNLQEEIKNLHEKHKKQLVDLKDEHDKQVKQNRRDFFERCQNLQIKYSNFVDKSKKHTKEFVQKLDQKQKQYQAEIQQEIRQKKQEILKIRAVNEDLQEKNRRLTEEYNQLKEEDERQQNRFQQLFKIHNSIRFENLKNDQDILKMQHQLLERLQVIDSKEETCRNARYEQTTLENFRYMLDSKIESLEGKKKQMMEKIAARESDLKNMFNELIRESQENQKKYFELKQLNAQVRVLETEIKKAETEIITSNGLLKNFQNQLSNIIKSQDDIKIIARKLHALLDECKEQQAVSANQTVVTSKNQTIHQNNQNVSQQEPQNEQVYEQLLRQAKWMGKKLHLIKSTAQNYKQIRQDNINTILSQNTKLIEECNDLRNANQAFKGDIKKYEKELAEFLRKKQKAESRRKLQSINMAGLNKKLQENEMKIGSQQTKLQSINEEMRQILARKASRLQRQQDPSTS